MTALKREAGVEASSSEEPLRVGSCLSVKAGRQPASAEVQPQIRGVFLRPRSSRLRINW